jgi:transcriptional regulator with XRE-family HTH domain
MPHDRHAPEPSASRVRDLGAFIREQRNTAQLSLRTLAERAGISNPYLSQIERGLRRPSADILQRVADALRISAETLYVQAGILEERRGDLDEHIRAAADLTEPQKRALLEIYHAFRSSSDQQISSPSTDSKEQS